MNSFYQMQRQAQARNNKINEPAELRIQTSRADLGSGSQSWDDATTCGGNGHGDAPWGCKVTPVLTRKDRKVWWSVFTGWWRYVKILRYLIFPVFPIVFFPFFFLLRGCYNGFVCMCDDWWLIMVNPPIWLWVKTPNTFLFNPNWWSLAFFEHLMDVARLKKTHDTGMSWCHRLDDWQPITGKMGYIISFLRSNGEIRGTCLTPPFADPSSGL